MTATKVSRSPPSAAKGRSRNALFVSSDISNAPRVSSRCSRRIVGVYRKACSLYEKDKLLDRAVSITETIGEFVWTMSLRGQHTLAPFAQRDLHNTVPPGTLDRENISRLRNTQSSRGISPWLCIATSSADGDAPRRSANFLATTCSYLMPSKACMCGREQRQTDFEVEHQGGLCFAGCT